MTQQDFYKALTAFKDGTPEPLHETVAVLSYEVGRLMENVMYMKWAIQERNDEESFKVRKGFAKSELMDVIAQSVLIAEALGVDFDEYKELGIEKAMERLTKKEVKL